MNTLNILKRWGKEDLAWVYLAEIRENKRIEFVESLTPPLKRQEKWVLIISTLIGCPIGCSICDAGGGYKGRLTKEEIFSQIDSMVLPRFPDRTIPVQKWKVQFCRMGEPTLNPAVLEVLQEMPKRYHAPGLKPSLSTMAPKGCEKFLHSLKKIKDKLYSQGRFQLQFFLHSTDPKRRDQIVPVKKLSFQEISSLGEEFYEKGDQKITLNFPLEKDSPLQGEVLAQYFNPQIFFIKITPLNPTFALQERGFSSYLDSEEEGWALKEHLESFGYEVLLSIGEKEENKIGSNCGQYVKNFQQKVSGEKGLVVNSIYGYGEFPEKVLDSITIEKIDKGNDS